MAASWRLFLKIRKHYHEKEIRKMAAYYMNLKNGFVDSLENWSVQIGAKEFDDALYNQSMLKVELLNGMEMPEDFKPCDSSKYYWQCDFGVLRVKKQ